jgi:hypothetical protein
LRSLGLSGDMTIKGFETTAENRRGAGWLLRRAAVVAVALTCLIWALQPSVAHAGIYTVYECHPDAGAPRLPDLVVSGGFDVGPAGGSSSFPVGWNANCSGPGTTGGYGMEVWGWANTEGCP